MKRYIQSKSNSSTETISYRGMDIEYNLYGQKEYTVQYCGDDMWFESLEEAKLFIDDTL